MYFRVQKKFKPVPEELRKLRKQKGDSTLYLPAFALQLMY